MTFSRHYHEQIYHKENVNIIAQEQYVYTNMRNMKVVFCEISNTASQEKIYAKCFFSYLP